MLTQTNRLLKLSILDTSKNRYISKYHILRESLIDGQIELTGGKYASKTFGQVFKEDRDYCKGLLNRKTKSSNLNLFRQYCSQEFQRQNFDNKNYVRIMASEISALAGNNKYSTLEESVAKHLIYFEHSFKKKAKYFALRDTIINKHNYNIFKNIFLNEYPEESFPNMTNITYQSELLVLEYKWPKIAKFCLELPIRYVDLFCSLDKIISTEEIVAKVTHKVACEIMKQKSEIIKQKFDTNASETTEIDTNTLDKSEGDISIDESTISVIANQALIESEKNNSLENLSLIMAEIYNNVPKINGIVNEDTVYNKLRKIGYDVRDSQQAFTGKFYIQNISVVIYGKVDGILYEHGNPVGIVEIKTRQNRFVVHSHDIDQVATYTILSNLSKGMLVQSFDGELKIKIWNKEELLPYWTNLLTSQTLYHSLKSILKLKNNPNSNEAVAFAVNNLLE
jgi:hypothetical protein